VKYIGGVSSLILLTKIIAHIILLFKIDADFSLFTVNPFVAKRQATVLLLPVTEKVPNRYRLLKTIINITYVLAFLGIVFFLIWNSFFRKHG
jgi:hypothetical protein